MTSWFVHRCFSSGCWRNMCRTLHSGYWDNLQTTSRTNRKRSSNLSNSCITLEETNRSEKIYIVETYSFLFDIECSRDVNKKLQWYLISTIRENRLLIPMASTITFYPINLKTKEKTYLLTNILFFCLSCVLNISFSYLNRQ